MFKWFPTFRKAGTFFQNNITRPGRSLLFLCFFCSLGLIYLESPLLYLFTTIVSVLVLASIVSFLFRPNIEYKPIVPDLVQAQKDVKADFYLTNRRQRSAFEVFFEIQPNPDEIQSSTQEATRLIHVIRPGKTVRESLIYQFLQRGVYALPKVVIGSTFPFNLFRFRQTKPSDQKVIVTPAFEPIREFQLPGSHQDNDFDDDRRIQMANVSGASEYIGNREYQEGMPVRRWDYPSWARTGKPIVREYREQERGTATIFIDSFFDQTQGTNEDFEALLSLATAIVDALSKRTIVVSRLIIGPTIYSIIDSNPDDQLRNIGRKLAVAETSPENDKELLLDEIFAEQAISSDSYGFLLFNKMTPEREHFVKQFRLFGIASVAKVLASEGRGKNGQEGSTPVLEKNIASVSKADIASGEVEFK